MTAPRIVRCCECDRPLAIYGEDEGEETCAACAESPPPIARTQRDAEAVEAALRG